MATVARVGRKLAELKRTAGKNVRESIGERDGNGKGRGEAHREPRTKGPDRWDGLTRSQAAAEIPVDRIVADPTQPRKVFDPEPLQRLAKSLMHRGQLQPIRVRWDEGLGKYVLLCGERRWRAAQLGGIPSLTAVIHDGAMSDDDRLIVQLLENCAREDLGPIEQAEALQALAGRGLSQRQIAEETGLSLASVNRSLALLETSAGVRAFVKQGDLPASVAYELSRLPRKGDQTELARQALHNQWSREDVQAEVRKRLEPAARSTVEHDPVVEGAIDHLKELESGMRSEWVPDLPGQVNFLEPPEPAEPVRACRVCGCTEADCHQCIERKGEPCHWIEEDLCSACVRSNREVPEVQFCVEEGVVTFEKSHPHADILTALRQALELAEKRFGPWTFAVVGRRDERPRYSVRAWSLEEAVAALPERIPGDRDLRIRAYWRGEEPAKPIYDFTRAAAVSQPEATREQAAGCMAVPLNPDPKGRGQDVSDLPAGTLAVACSHCGAEIGRPCIAGEGFAKGFTHAARVRRAEKRTSRATRSKPSTNGKATARA